MWVYLYICGYVEKYHICGLKVGVRITGGYLRYICDTFWVTPGRDELDFSALK